MNAIKKRLRSFGYAFNGIFLLFSTQPHATFHFIATIIVVAAGFFFGISGTEWLVLIVTIGIVWVSEAINTALEFLTDLVSPDYNLLAKKVKDVAAGAVLIAVVFALIIGITIFYPKIKGLLQ